MFSEGRFEKEEEEEEGENDDDDKEEDKGSGELLLLTIISFGNNNGKPKETSKNWDVRNYPNPPKHLRDKHTGLHKALREEVFKTVGKRGGRKKGGDGEGGEELYCSLFHEVVEFVLEWVSDLEKKNNEGKKGDNFGQEKEKEVKEVKEEGEEKEKKKEGEKEEEEEEAEEEDESEEERKNDFGNQIAIGIGCHQGKHRSVAIVERLCEEIPHKTGVQCVPYHRDLMLSKKDRGKQKGRGERGKRRG